MNARLRTQSLTSLRGVGRLALAFAAGLVVMIFALSLTGASPVQVLRSMAQSVTSRAQQTDALLQAIPVLLIALGSCICFRARFWNIGGESYFYVGGLAAVAIGLRFKGLPGPLAILMMLLGAAAAGGILSGIAGFLRAYKGVNEVLVTLMMNLAMIQIVAFAVRGPLADPQSRLAYSEALPDRSWLPAAGLGLAPQVHVGIYLAIVAAFLTYYVLVFSSFGHRISVIGANYQAARAAGIDVPKTILGASIALGILGGLAGMVQVAGVSHRIYFGLSPSPGFGYIAIMTALLATLHPLLAVVSTVFFTMMRNTGDLLQVQFGIPRGFVTVIFGVVLLLLLASEGFSKDRERLQT